jgi:OmcA/MtrC family decaheme c-type cytochrome
VENSWTLARLGTDPATSFPAYQSLLLPTRPSGSESEQSAADLGDGRFRYRFETALPEGLPPGETLRVGLFSRLRTNPGGSPAEFDPDQPNVVFDFVPDGSRAPVTREVVSDQACSVCHEEVRAHGGFRRGVAICTTCHTTQLFDPDTTDPALLEAQNPLDLGRLVHRIHRGRQLQTITNVLNAARGCTTPTDPSTCPTAAPAVDAQAAAIAAAGPLARYEVVGFQGQRFTFGEAAVRTENGNRFVLAQGVSLPPPNDVRNCTQCHAGAKDAGQHLELAARRTCTGCHTDVWFNSATPPDAFHVVHQTDFGPLPLTNDQACNGCHAQSNAFPPVAAEFGRFVDLAHTVDIKSGQLRGLRVDIVGFQNAGPGQAPTLTFRVSNGNDGSAVTSLAAPAISSIRATVNGPTRPDYVYFNNYFQENLQTGSTFDPASGLWTHPFTTAIPAAATGTWVVGIEARRTVALANADEPAGSPQATRNVTEGAENALHYFNPGGGPPEERRLVVAQDKCNACHLDLQFHGNQRELVQYCAVCHTPDLTDWGRRPKVAGSTPPAVDVAATADGLEERSVHLKVMIHRIHRGSGLELTRPLAIYGFSGPVFFTPAAESGVVRFGGLPEPARDRCASCHEGDTYLLERMPPGAAGTLANETPTPRHAGTGAHAEGEPRIPPMTAACISCHDTPFAVDHASQFAPPRAPAERCVECHGQGAVRAVDAVHEIGP